MITKGLDPTKAFLGSGWGFPVRLNPDGSIVEVAYEDDVREAIRIILLTNPGERLMRPAFGAGLGDFAFEPLSVATMESVRARVRSALIAWEPRIDVLDVTVTADATHRNCLLIDMTYRVRATNSRLNLVFPFYLEEGTTT